MDAKTLRFDFGDIGMKPITQDWGFSRGLPVDRRYIEQFLSDSASVIQGRVLEFGDCKYTRLYGGERVSQSDILDNNNNNRKANIIADITNACSIESNTYDCLIVTQVLVLIRDYEEALAELIRILKPGGTALITVPGISQISPLPTEAANWSWSFYPNTMRSLLEMARFEHESIKIASYGNLKTTIAFLAGLAQEDLEQRDYEFNDPQYPLIVAALARKPHLRALQ
ncbi:MAG: methyltransferase domain-containing protein [Prochlorococcaceae cyanobacterium]